MRCRGEYPLLCFLLMPGIQVTEQKADCDRLWVFLQHSSHSRLEFFKIDFCHHLAARPDPFCYLDPAMPGHDRRRKIDVHIVVDRSGLPPDLQQVPKPFGRNESNTRPASLKQRVGPHCCSVSYEFDFSLAQVMFLSQLIYAPNDGVRRIARGRCEFMRINLASLG